MPELAEVVYYRNQWLPAIGRTVAVVRLHPGARVFREADPETIASALPERKLLTADTHGKGMRFLFSGGLHLGVHLGMAGRLFTTPLPYQPDKHDHLVIELKGRTAPGALVFNDYRMFGRIRLHEDAEAPPWWRDLPPEPQERRFTRARFEAILERRSRAPLKAVLLDQACFPGFGNWMADEALWRARLFPGLRATGLRKEERARLYRDLRKVARDALRVIAPDWTPPPANWLFPHRWKDGGACPRDHTPLERETLGGRTTCYCPVCQPPVA